MVIASPHNMSKLVDKPEIKVLGKSLEQVTGNGYLGMTIDQYLGGINMSDHLVKS